VGQGLGEKDQLEAVHAGGGQAGVARQVGGDGASTPPTHPLLDQEPGWLPPL